MSYAIAKIAPAFINPPTQPSAFFFPEHRNIISSPVEHPYTLPVLVCRLSVPPCGVSSLRQQRFNANRLKSFCVLGPQISASWSLPSFERRALNLSRNSCSATKPVYTQPSTPEHRSKLPLSGRPSAFVVSSGRLDTESSTLMDQERRLTCSSTRPLRSLAVKSGLTWC